MDSRQRRRFAKQSCWLLFACLTSASASFGQEGVSAGASNIEILKLHWEKQLRLPRNFDPSIIPATSGDFTDPAKTGSPTSAATATQPAFQSTPYVTFASTPSRLGIVYVYSLKVRNVGARSIAAIAWEYTFVDSENNELGRHRFLSYRKVPAQTTRSFREQLRSPPVRVISPSDSAKNPSRKLRERAVIQCVLYADGSVWQNPRATDGVCDLLKNGKALAKRRRDAN